MAKSEALKIWNKMLDAVEDSFRTFTSKNFAGVKVQTHRNRGHEDALNIIFSWQGDDAIERDIATMICFNSLKGNSPELVVSVYAWEMLKNREADLVSKYKGEEVARLPLPLNPDHLEDLQAALQQAYSRVCEWDAEDLMPLFVNGMLVSNLD